MSDKSADQKVLLQDLARSLLYQRTQSEKLSNQRAQEIMGDGGQEELIQSIYQRIAEKKPHVIRQLNYLGQGDCSERASQETQISNNIGAADNSHLLTEVVTTQITQVAYHLRQKKRAFDTACLLELLSKDFLERKKCIATSRDLSKSPADEFRPKIFKMSQNAKMIQLLLALSKNPQSCDQNRSQFSQNYLKKKIKQNEDKALFVKPHLAEYVQADCKLTERDKTVGGRQKYVAFDTASFENPTFKQYDAQMQSMLGGAQPYKLEELQSTEANRFNADLVRETSKNGADTQPTEERFQVGVSASGGQQPAPLLGATLRSLEHASKVVNNKGEGLFGAGAVASGTSAFGMTLQIPSLPQIDQRTMLNEDGSIDTNQIQPTFSFFQPSASDESTKTETNKITQTVKPKASLNFAVPKQKQDQRKKKDHKLNVWSLLPYVDENALENNMAKESGIARLWEDESIHLQMRNLSVCEPGVITAQKEASFRACFKASVGSVIRVPGSSKTIKERDLVRSLILVLQGIPSTQVFELEKTTFTFNTNPNLVISDLCCTSASLQQLCDEFTQAGCYFLHLREFSEFMSSHKSKGAGQVVEAFALAIQDFLVFYQHQVNELERKAKVHREERSQSSHGDRYVSLLEIKVLMAPLLAQIQTIASICFTQKFIEDIQFQQEEKKGDISADQSLDDGNNEFKFMALLYQRNALTAENLKEQLEENLEKIRSEQWLNEFPRGAKLLTYLYRIMLASEADLQVIDLLRRIFGQAVRPILLMISEFITIGSFEDPFQEFFVEKLYRSQEAKQKQAESMNQEADMICTEDDFIFKISQDPEKIPVFFRVNDTAATIFKIGCDLNLLKTKRQQILTETQQQSQGLQIESQATATRVNLPDYFAICAASDSQVPTNESRYPSQEPRSKLRMVDQPSRMLTLDFSMEVLQQKNLVDSRLFEHQSDMLQRIERQIAQEETDALLQVISLREKAAIFRMTESEKERQRAAQAQAEKKRKLMQEIQEDIAQRQKNKEAQAQKELAERERMRQEQLEYEKIQKALKENLKQKLMDILKENQTLADTRTQDAIQREILDQQVNELEHNVEEAKQEVAADDASPSHMATDVDMIDENGQSSSLKPDEEMIVDSGAGARKEQEAAGKASTTTQGGIAKLLFGKGQSPQEDAKEESSEEKMQLADVDSSEGSGSAGRNNNEEVKLEEIQLDLAPDEKQLITDTTAAASKGQDNPNPEQNKDGQSVKEPEETDAEKVEFIQSVFIKPLLSRVFKFINEKKAMDSKRKTWNLKHQVEQVEDLKRKKINLEYHSTQKSTLKARMAVIFQEHLAQSKVQVMDDDDDEVKSQASFLSIQETDDQIFNIPVALAIEQSIIQVIDHQHKLVNKCLLHMMHRGMFLLRHLEYLKMVFLGSQGDVFQSLHEGIFNDDFQQTAKDSSLQFLNSQLELAVRSSRPERHYGTRSNANDQSGSDRKVKPIELGVNLAQLISEDGTELTRFRFAPSGRSGQLNVNPNFFFTLSNIGEYVRLEYATEHPLDRVISQQCLVKYNTLFFFLLKLKRVSHCLTLIWKDLNGAEFRRISQSEFRELRKLQFLWQQMQYFLRTFDEYVMVAVIQSQWKELKRQLAQINYFEELISLHNSYLDNILEKCFLRRAGDNRLQVTINQIFQFVIKLHFIVRNYGVGVCRDYRAKTDLQNISKQFGDYSRFLYQIVRNLAQKGQFKELFIRLDFNKFYQNTAIGTGAPTRNIIQ